MFRSVLAVCVGNICRSPMAEALLRQGLEAKGVDARVESAGIGALIGAPADPVAQQLMQQRGLDISAHRARQLSYDLLRQFELVLVMEKSHQQRIEQLAPIARGRVFTLGKWGGFEIPDPYCRPLAAFEESLRLIDVGVKDWLVRI